MVLNQCSYKAGLLYLLPECRILPLPDKSIFGHSISTFNSSSESLEKKADG